MAIDNENKKNNDQENFDQIIETSAKALSDTDLEKVSGGGMVVSTPTSRLTGMGVECSIGGSKKR